MSEAIDRKLAEARARVVDAPSTRPFQAVDFASELDARLRAKYPNRGDFARALVERRRLLYWWKDLLPADVPRMHREALKQAFPVPWWWWLSLRRARVRRFILRRMAEAYTWEGWFLPHIQDDINPLPKTVSDLQALGADHA